jgi:hypothetical protein
MNNHIKGVLISFIVIIIVLYIVSDCNTSILNRPIWPCPYNENRLRNLYINESSGKWTSQSLFDIYSFTHINHGILLFYVLYYIHKKKKYTKMIYIALFYEILWETIENTPIIINKYRKESNISRNYAGDSIINSIGDICSMSVGFFITWYYPEHGYKLLITNELLLYYLINDNLMTNIYQIFIK